MHRTKQRTAQAAKVAHQQLDSLVFSIFNANGHTMPDMDTLHQELSTRANLSDLLAVDVYNAVYVAEHELLAHWLRNRREFIAPMDNHKAGSLQRSYQYDGTRFIHLPAVLAEATRDPDTEDADERRKQGIKTVKALAARYRAMGKPYMAQAKMLDKIVDELGNKATIFQPQLMSSDLIAG